MIKKNTMRERLKNEREGENTKSDTTTNKTVTLDLDDGVCVCASQGPRGTQKEGEEHTLCHSLQICDKFKHWGHRS